MIQHNLRDQWVSKVEGIIMRILPPKKKKTTLENFLFYLEKTSEHMTTFYL
jgi:hypothetical protein